MQLGETGGLVWGRVPAPPTLPPRPSTYLLLNVRQRLDGQISKGREGLVGRGRSDLDPDPYLEPRSLIFEPLSISAWTSIPSLFLPQPLATSIQLPLWTPPFQTPPCPPAPTLGLQPPPAQKLGLSAAG